MERDWEGFLAPYEQTVSELKVKLRGIHKTISRTESTCTN